MTVIEKISQMETRLNHNQEQLDALVKQVESYQELLPDLKVLATYYGSPDWFNHLELDQEGKLPDNLPRGVLSEDAIYNLLLSCRELSEQLRDLAAAIEDTLTPEP